MSDLLYWSTIACCVGACGGCMCRLRVINVFTARLDYVLMHVVWLGYAGWAGFETVRLDRPLDFELLPLVGIVLWLRLSRWSWIEHGGPPPHILRGKALQELETDVLRHVVGGTKR